LNRVVSRPVSGSRLNTVPFTAAVGPPVGVVPMISPLKKINRQSGPEPST
jgi:hypothetical protein